MIALSKLTPFQGIETALNILLEYGFEAKYSDKNWKEAFVSWSGDNFDDYSDDCTLSEIESVWSVLVEYVPQNVAVTDPESTLVACYEADEYDVVLSDREAHFVVLSLSDGQTTRYFKQSGWYSSYGENSLAEGHQLEVFPKEITVTEWSNAE